MNATELIMGWVVTSTTTFLIGLWNGRRLERAAEALAQKNRITKAKDDFGVFIRGQSAMLPQMKVKEFYIRTKPAIGREIYKFWHFLTDDQRSRLDRLWKEYDEIPEARLSEDRENEFGTTWDEQAKEAGEGVSPKNPGHPRDVLKQYFDEFYKFSA